MTTDNTDEEFERLTAGLSDELREPHPSIGIDTSISNLEILRRFREVKEKLLDRGELLDPKTEQGKDLQTQYQGYLIEMKHRRMK